MTGVRQAISTPSARAELRTWPLDPSLVHLVMVDVSMTPTADQVDAWLAAAYAAPQPGHKPTRAVRTGALYPAAASAFLASGFVVVDRLALLERTLTGPQSRGRRDRTVSLHRVRRRDLPVLAEIDQEAFPAGWGNDATSLAEIADATPAAHSRVAHTRGRSSGTPLGFAITGRAGTTGYLQRIAVRPDARRAGVGRRLVDDAVDWLMRRGVSRALVNTGLDNIAALELYERAAFERLDDELVVLEHHRSVP